MRIDKSGQNPALGSELRTGYRVCGPSISVGIEIDWLSLRKSKTADPQHCHHATPY
ncbi:hypothetical protein BC793_13265 [Actinoplanes xinjiangensis]|uniref:Uncharacterized protein n=1 Tax=Actinoplanes xinjiangensis TaxID=512350 RepID=A0A316ELN7_9ACTN|nr:hypothetical protein BC793_13265 [Actinoplanes xinjiangensis]GIF43909.1 hypothetical protein Axi01nite_82200 [Actinoplanes xinjiangensis]